MGGGGLTFLPASSCKGRFPCFDLLLVFWFVLDFSLWVFFCCYFEKKNDVPFLAPPLSK